MASTGREPVMEGRSGSEDAAEIFQEKIFWSGGPAEAELSWGNYSETYNKRILRFYQQNVVSSKYQFLNKNR